METICKFKMLSRDSKIGHTSAIHPVRLRACEVSTDEVLDENSLRTSVRCLGPGETARLCHYSDELKVERPVRQIKISLSRK